MFTRVSMAIALASVAGLTGMVAAQSQFVINNNSVLTGLPGSAGMGSSYAGPNDGGFDLRGAVVNGGIDAYDYAGLIFADSSFGYSPAPAGLSITRRTDTLTDLNVFRWVITLTNTTSSTITTPVSFFSRIGYDSPNFTDPLNDPYRFVTFENRVLGTVVQADIPGNPVIGMMHGNNWFTANNIQWARNPNSYLEVARRWNLSLAPGQSQTLMFADFLAFTLDENGNAGSGGQPSDIALVLDSTSGFLSSAFPLFQGLDQTTISAISNWSTFGVPTPGAVSVLALGGLMATRRRR